MFSADIFSQELSVTVSYLRGEISKDSFSSNESYSINGTALASSTSSKGRTGDKDGVPKLCTLEEKDTVAIRNLILTGGFNVSDSLITLEKLGIPRFFTKISIAITLDGTESTINIDGDTELLAENEYYKNVMRFIMYMRNTAINCK